MIITICLIVRRFLVKKFFFVTACCALMSGAIASPIVPQKNKEKEVEIVSNVDEKNPNSILFLKVR